MNIFVVNTDPIEAAVSLCDKHVPKMTVESVQMLVSALRRHGAQDQDVPLTAKGTPHKGGYANHPSTVWAGETSENFDWLLTHAEALAQEFTFRFNKEHACLKQLDKIKKSAGFVPKGSMSNVALCVGPNLQEKYGATHLPMHDAVSCYREFYVLDKAEFAAWDKGRNAPNWWDALTDNNNTGSISS